MKPLVLEFDEVVATVEQAPGGRVQLQLADYAWLSAAVVLTPAEARQFAAALVAVADEEPAA